MPLTETQKKMQSDRYIREKKYFIERISSGNILLKYLYDNKTNSSFDKKFPLATFSNVSEHKNYYLKLLEGKPYKLEFEPMYDCRFSCSTSYTRIVGNYNILTKLFHIVIHYV